jgi:hypothetical protein
MLWGVRIEYQLTNGDMAEADFARSGKRDRGLGTFINRYAAGLFVIVYFSLVQDRVPGWRVGHETIWWLAIGAVGWLVLLGGLSLSVGRGLRAAASAMPWLDELQIVEVDEKMLVETDGAERTEYRWRAFDWWKETESLILIGGVTVPKRAMDGQQLGELRELVTRKLEKAGRTPERVDSTALMGPGRRSVECHLGEFREAIRFLYQTPAVRRRRRLNTVAVVTCLGIMAALQMRSVMRGTPTQRAVMLTGVALLGVIIGLVAWWLKRRLLKATWMLHEVQYGRVCFEVVPEGFAIGDTDWRTVMPWEVFVGFWETPNLFVLQRSATDPAVAQDPSKADIIIIPKRVFQTDLEVEEFRSVLAGNLDKGDGRGFEVLQAPQQRPVHVDSLEGRDMV